tara:strand:+ start:7493 stop:8413 length:921 start_codon:yes stop_codon:yes gene_type:complete
MSDEMPSEESDLRQTLNARRTLTEAVLETYLRQIFRNRRQYSMFKKDGGDGGWVSQAVDDVVAKHKLGEEIEGEAFGVSKCWDAMNQVLCEVGFYFRDVSPFDTLHTKQIFNALFSGMNQDFVAQTTAEMIASAVQTAFDWNDVEYDPSDENIRQLVVDIYDMQFAALENHDDMRQVITAVEQIIPEQMQMTVGSVIEIICSSVQRGLPHVVIKSWAKDTILSLCGEFSEGDGIIGHAYYREWVWDMFASRAGWAKTMEWETLANHGVCNATLWDIVEDHMMTYFADRVKAIESEDTTYKFSEDMS